MSSTAKNLTDLASLTQEEADRILGDESLHRNFDKLGIDLGLIVSNLRCSPEMRFKRHTNALRMALAFRKAGEEARRK